MNQIRVVFSSQSWTLGCSGGSNPMIPAPIMSSMTIVKAIGYSQTRNQVALWVRIFSASAESASSIVLLLLGDREEDLLEVALLGRQAEEIGAGADQAPDHLGRLGPRRADDERVAVALDRPARGEGGLGDLGGRGLDPEAVVLAKQIGDGRFADDLALRDDR